MIEPCILSLGNNCPDPGSRDVLLELLGDRHELRMRVSGHSMQPTLLTNDLVSLHQTSVDELRRGDLILFIDTQNNMVLHRLIRMNNNTSCKQWLQTGGDSATCLDPRITTDQVIARVKTIERHLAGQARIINLSLPGGRITSRLHGMKHYLRFALLALRSRLKTGLNKISMDDAGKQTR